MSKLVKSIKPEITQKQDKTIEELDERIDDLEQYSRRNCLKFSGIKETKGENTDALIINIINNVVLAEN